MYKKSLRGKSEFPKIEYVVPVYVILIKYVVNYLVIGIQEHGSNFMFYFRVVINDHLVDNQSNRSRKFSFGRIFKSFFFANALFQIICNSKSERIL